MPLIAAATAVVLSAFWAAGGWAAAPVPVGGKIASERACYVRLPDLPAGRYGGFGAYNPETGVLAYAGGAEKRTSENTITYSSLFAILLDGPAAEWSDIPYGSAGYNRAVDRGCREMVSVALRPSRWLSVFGKDGCDNGRVDTKKKKGGDLRELRIGATADKMGVRWSPTARIGDLPAILRDKKAKLTRAFAVFDTTRERVIVGQGTFDTSSIEDTRTEVYSASSTGGTYQVREMHPTGQGPGRRYGSCGAYVYDGDLDLDGVLVVGGHSPGSAGEALSEVWWLDLHRRDGEWRDLTPRVVNQDVFGARREGACAYDPRTKSFLSWMGRASKDIPDGAKRSAGAWRLPLEPLADDRAPLGWERLAPDDLEGVTGRRHIPSIWDPVEGRMLVVGGRNSLDELTDVWAIYPDVTGPACEALDPFARFKGRVPTPAPRPTPGPTPAGLVPRVCPELAGGRVPAAAIAAALASPQGVSGWAQLANPALPAGPTNRRRTSLSLRNPALVYHPMSNGLLYRAGCR